MHTIDVVIETPKNSIFKFTFEEKLNRYRLKKVLPAGMVFSYDFGFIPNTKGEDGDPLDVLVFSEHPLTQGCIVECNIVGSIKAEQTEKGNTVRNDRIIGVPVITDLHQKIKSVTDISEGKLKEIEIFFINYNEIADKKFNPMGHLSAEETWTTIQEQKK